MDITQTEQAATKPSSLRVTRETMARPARDEGELKQFLLAFRGAFAAALPRHITAERMIRVSLSAIQRNPALAQCTLGSLLACIMEAASLGLEFDARGLAYLVPYKNTRTRVTVCTLIIGYKGYCDLAHRTGMVRYVRAECVHERDVFDYAYGSNQFIVHKPARGDRGRPTGEVYAHVVLTNGGEIFHVIGPHDIEQAMRASASARKGEGPWVDPDTRPRMEEKTAVRRLARFMPQSVEFHGLARAVAVDEHGDRAMTRALDTVATLDIPLEAVDSGTDEQADAPAIRPPRALTDAQPPDTQPSGAEFDRAACAAAINASLSAIYRIPGPRATLARLVLPRGAENSTDEQLRTAETKLRLLEATIARGEIEKPQDDHGIALAVKHIEEEMSR